MSLSNRTKGGGGGGKGRWLLYFIVNPSLQFGLIFFFHFKNFYKKRLHGKAIAVKGTIKIINCYAVWTFCSWSFSFCSEFHLSNQCKWKFSISYFLLCPFQVVCYLMFQGIVKEKEPNYITAKWFCLFVCLFAN